MVNIINSSDDRVYPNITTSNTNTAVTLPTSVEFCVTLVAEDSIGRRGPDSAPKCVGEITMQKNMLLELNGYFSACLVSPSSVIGRMFTDVNLLSTMSVVMRTIDHEIGMYLYCMFQIKNESAVSACLYNV